MFTQRMGCILRCTVEKSSRCHTKLTSTELYKKAVHPQKKKKKTTRTTKTTTLLSQAAALPTFPPSHTRQTVPGGTHHTQKIQQKGDSPENGTKGYTPHTQQQKNPTIRRLPQTSTFAPPAATRQTQRQTARTQNHTRPTPPGSTPLPPKRKKRGKRRNTSGSLGFSFPEYRSCNARAESQRIVRLADSHTYNTPLLNKVVYNLSISPDVRVVIQRAPSRLCKHTGSTPIVWFRDLRPILTRVISRKGVYRRYSAWILT